MTRSSSPVLVSAAAVLRSNAGQFVLAVDHPQLLRVIDLVDVRRSLRVERSYVEAIEYVVNQRLSA